MVRIDNLNTLMPLNINAILTPAKNNDNYTNSNKLPQQLHLKNEENQQ